MLGPIKTEEIAQPAGVDHLRFDLHAFGAFIHPHNAEFVIAAGVGQDMAGDPAGRQQRRQRINRTDHRAGQEQHVIGDVENPFAVHLQIPIGL